VFLFDTIGIGLFMIIGIKIALENNLSTEVSLLMGVISACFGGVVRDVLTNEIPLIFREEIYASACFAGGIVYLLLTKFTGLEDLSIIVSICSVILIRYFSIKYNWTLNFNRFT